VAQHLEGQTKVSRIVAYDQKTPKKYKKKKKEEK
jgi:hypothetical protein